MHAPRPQHTAVCAALPEAWLGVHAPGPCAVRGLWRVGRRQVGAGHSQHWALGQLWPSQHHTVAGITALPRWETEARKQPGRTADEGQGPLPTQESLQSVFTPSALHLRFGPDVRRRGGLRLTGGVRPPDRQSPAGPASLQAKSAWAPALETMSQGGLEWDRHTDRTLAPCLLAQGRPRSPSSAPAPVLPRAPGKEIPGSSATC